MDDARQGQVNVYRHRANAIANQSRYQFVLTADGDDLTMRHLCLTAIHSAVQSPLELSRDSGRMGRGPQHETLNQTAL